MTKKRLDVTWEKEIIADDFRPALKRFRGYLRDNGIRDSTSDMYVFRVGKYMEFAHSDMPSDEDFLRFRELLLEKAVSRSTLNNYSFSIKKYYEMIGKTINFPFIQPRNNIPYFFDENDISRIFGVCGNIKHLSMLQTMFYACLRAQVNSATWMIRIWISKL
jgi:hypothetical protein